VSTVLEPPTTIITITTTTITTAVYRNTRLHRAVTL